MNDLPKTVRVVDRTVHNEDNVTLLLDVDMEFSPGQFLMIWLPGINEKPFSIAGQDDRGVLITVRRRGEFSGRLIDLTAGDSVGVRGPYGRAFDLVEPCCLMAGGIGFACLAPIADLYPNAPILYGENHVGNRLYQSRFPHASLYTVDGSAGRKGFPTDDLEDEIRKTGCQMVYVCGPEPMLVKAVEICAALDVACQASIDRYMKCGIGVCGQCACGPDRVCVEGPVFDGKDLLRNPDFGKRRLDAAGAWQPV